MSRTRWAAVALVLAAAAATLVPLAASAFANHRVMISERNLATGPTTQAGTFVAAGSVNDSGTVAVTFSIQQHGAHKGLLTGTHVLTGSNGTITVQTRAWVRPYPPPTPPRVLVEGQWRVVSGTGAYAGLHGHGKVFATGDFTTGEITIIRRGEAH
jgi:hypothetical protein